MLENFISPSGAERLRSGVLGEHVDGFCELLVGYSYAPATIRAQLWVVGSLARWMAEHGHAVTDLDEACIAEYVKAHRKPKRDSRGLQRTGLTLLEQLRSAAVISAPEPASDDSPFATLLAQYETYLRQERALTAGTISRYVQIARTLLHHRSQDHSADIASLSAGDIHDFQLVRSRQVSPKQAQYTGSSLRSFLRFLFMNGHTRTDLVLAVVSVRRSRQTGVPRYMPAEDVEKMLRSCDSSTVTGRRDHAILLLLARLGLRASEVVALELADLRWREGEIIIRGKGLVHDRVPMLSDVGEALALYLKTDRPDGALRRVFLCRRAPHRGLGHPSTVSTIVMRALLRAGLSPATHGAHLLRHSLATTMVRHGASFSEIGQVLRHRSPNTTEIYAKLDFGALRDIALPWPASRGGQ